MHSTWYCRQLAPTYTHTQNADDNTQRIVPIFRNTIGTFARKKRCPKASSEDLEFASRPQV